MGFLERSSMGVLLFILLLACGIVRGKVYKVGDDAGWTIVGNVDYKSWAASKTFQVGDVILFEYNKQFHNVMRVNHKNFRQCVTTGAYATFTSGNDSFVIKRPGHYYFICGVPGHCQGGQKVDIRVLPNKGPSPAVPPSSWSPSHPPSAGGSSPASVPVPYIAGYAPAPSPQKNIGTKRYGIMLPLYFVMTGFAASYFVF